MKLDESNPVLWQRLAPRMTRTQLPVVAGFEAALTGAPVQAALNAHAYGLISGVLAAALKILRVGQTSIQEILFRKSAALPDLVTRSLKLEEDDLGSFTPLLDIASARHERAFSRLFLS